MRICDLDLKKKNGRSTFANTLNSFAKLEELDIIRLSFSISAGYFQHQDLPVDLPMVKRIQLSDLTLMGVKKITLKTPRAQEVKIWNLNTVAVSIVHGESVETLIIDRFERLRETQLTKLKFLYIGQLVFDSTILSGLKELKEIHLSWLDNCKQLFVQKKRYGRADLKIYHLGLLLNGPDDPAFGLIYNTLDKETFAHLAANPSRLADQIPLQKRVFYASIEPVPRGSEMNVVSRFTDLNTIQASERVQDIERFLDLLKNVPNIVELVFLGDQPQELFDRLPEKCSGAQKLAIHSAPSDVSFVFELKHLIHLAIGRSFDAEFVRKAFQELHFLSFLDFKPANVRATIEVDNARQYEIWVGNSMTKVADLDAAIQFIFPDKRPNKRKAGYVPMKISRVKQ